MTHILIKNADNIYTFDAKTHLQMQIFILRSKNNKFRKKPPAK